MTEARGRTRQTDDDASMRDVGRVLAKGTIATIAKDEKSNRDSTTVEPVTEQVKEKTFVTLQENSREKNTAKDEDTSLIDKERIEKEVEELVEEAKYNVYFSGVNRGRGGGEGQTKIWRQFACTSEQGNMAKVKQSPGPSVSTQLNTTRITSPTGRARSKTFPHLKLNKVDPVEAMTISISEEDHVSGRPRHEISHETTHVNRTARGV
ncbi:uncharacterized protein LOC112589449 [Harpegnathos saltator]|uniref:uncharacterized protein LOC112589449 n=1 Tax=Harpegnathos saltator TaxID=610380 RepID=UPI000DBEE4CF|nr:uncharacterized protein LOC112589449 [Harpegnathos saltator]